jgi:alkylation response protein AidB-like acyl-CoA dehydrogenase
MQSEPITLDEALATIAQGAQDADSIAAWPETSWQAIRRAGVLGWCASPAEGGSGLGPLELLEGYERVAGACLTTTFILSQREAAFRRVRESTNDALKLKLLPPLARGETFATVGLSQITTSRQHLKPTFSASIQGRHFVCNGTIPWVTGASQAEHIVIGAVLDGGEQILAVLPRELPGVTVGPPLPLMALEGSLTAEVRCRDVVLERQWLLAGPAREVMAIGRGGTGGLETSCLALGLAGAATGFLKREAEARPDLRGTYNQLEKIRLRLRQEMHQLAQGSCGSEDAANLRARANTLVLRATQAALTASKGTGFLRDHPAQRWARQALFFLVWSCPRPAADATLAYLAQPEPYACP